jgi:hypothetical protein
MLSVVSVHVGFIAAAKTPASPTRKKQVAEDDEEDPIAHNVRAFEPELTDEIPVRIDESDAERAHETAVPASEHDHGR